MASRATHVSPIRGGSSSRGYQWRGRGRGGAGFRGLTSKISATSTSVPGPSTTTRNPPKPPLTHFLALPLGHHEPLRHRLTAFTSALLHANPTIPGLDQSIVVSPRRMHLTLGVMSLAQKTLQAAIGLLNELKPRIMALLAGHTLQVPLSRVDIMKPERSSLEQAHVFWAGPPEHGDDVARLRAVCDLIHNEFKRAGFVVDEGPALKLHCTVLNTTYRKPRGRRTPFSYSALLASPAFHTIEQLIQEPASRDRGRSPIPVDLGNWKVDEVQICEMGSWGPEGEYVCVGRVPLGE